MKIATAGETKAEPVRPGGLMIGNSGTETWMRTWLWLAAAYNILWGGTVVLFPQTTLRWIGMDDATPALWQCIGMIIGVYGIGYAIAAFDPLRHWPIVLVGWLGKIFGPIGYAMGLLQGELPLTMGWTILTNDLIWWIPFTALLLAARRHQAASLGSNQPMKDPGTQGS